MPDIAIIGSQLSCGGAITSGSTSVKAGGIGVARHGDLCVFSGPCPYIPGSPPTPCPTCTVIATAAASKANSKAIARVGDLTTRSGASIVSGYSSVQVGS